MSDPRRDAVRAHELAEAAKNLADIAERARQHAQRLGGPAGRVAPLHAEADALIAGTSSSAHQEIRAAIDGSLARIKTAQAALDNAARRAAAAAAQAQAAARSAQNGRR